MKWLIVAPNFTDNNISVMEDFLDSTGTEYTEIFIENGTKTIPFSSDIQTAMNVTHCVILDSYQMIRKSDYALLLGVLMGRNVTTFIYTGQKYARHYEKIKIEGQTFFRCYDELPSLLNYVKNNFELFKADDRQKTALKTLFSKGIPFTSDSLAYYIQKDKPEICEMLMTAGMIADSYTSEGVPMLCVATRCDSFEKVEWLLDNGANINAVSKDRGYTAVMDAVWRKNYDITKYLIEQGADLSIISTDGQPILVLAVGNGNVKIVNLLLEHGADPDVKDSMGMSARGYAVLFKRPEMIEAMKKFPPKE